MDYIVGWIIGLAVLALVVAILFFVITRGVRPSSARAADSRRR